MAGSRAAESGISEPERGEWALLIAAQLFVDEWHRNPGRRPFARAVEQAAYREVGTRDEDALDRRIFMRIANAIRLGTGHAQTNPAPLLSVIRRMRAQSAC